MGSEQSGAALHLAWCRAFFLLIRLALLAFGPDFWYDTSMTTVPIPKHLVGRGDLIVIPRSVYEDFVELERQIKSRRIYVPTKAERKALARARARYAKGQYALLSEL